MEEYSNSNSLVLHGQIASEDNIDDVVKLYMPKKREQKSRCALFCFRVCRFFLMVVAFFLIYYCLYKLYVKNAVSYDDLPASVMPGETFQEETQTEAEVKLPVVVNESMLDINIEDYIMEEQLGTLPYSEGIQVIIVNSHSSESVSDTLSVKDLANDLTKILQSRGVGAYYDESINDSAGAIGAYTRMSENVSKLKATYNESVVLIDLHSSDSGEQITFTVGCKEDFAWRENLRFSCGIYNLMKETEAAFRILPSALGQDNGLLSVNVGIGGKHCSDSEVRVLLSSFADALSQMFNNEPLA